MKHLRETFTEEEWKLISEAKSKVKQNWHDLIINSILDYASPWQQPSKEVKTK